MRLRNAVPALVAVALVALLLHRAPSGVAQPRGDIGVIDLEIVWNERLLPALEGPLARETARLQAELDAAVANRPEAERQQLFDEYQARLYAYQQELVDNLLAQVREVIASVAKELGLSVVLDANSVMYGGVDVTEAVLDRLP